MMGARVSRGRLRITVATLSRTSWVATSIFRESSKVTITTELPGPEIERSSLMPATVLTTSSMRCETWISISSVEAPARVVRTVTVGRSTAGKRSTPRRK